MAVGLISSILSWAIKHASHSKSPQNTHINLCLKPPHFFSLLWAFFNRHKQCDLKVKSYREMWENCKGLLPGPRLLTLGLASVPEVRRGISYLLVWLLLNLVNTDATWTSLNNESRKRIAAGGNDVREGFLWLKDFACIDRLKGYRTIKKQCQG